MTKKSAGPPPQLPPLFDPDTPTPAPPTVEGAALGPPDAATSALSAALDEPILTDADSGATQLLSSAVPNGLSDPFGSAEAGWFVGSKDVGPYNDITAARGALNSFTGQDLNPYTNVAADGANPNAFTGDQNVNPFTGVQATPSAGTATLDASQMPASNGASPETGAVLVDTSQLPGSTGSTPVGVSSSAPGARYVSNDVLSGETPIDQIPVDGHNTAHYQLMIDGVTYDGYFSDAGSHHDQVLLIPSSSPSPTATPPATTQMPQAAPAASLTSAPPTTAPSALLPTSSPPVPSPTSDLWSTILGDVLAGIASIFGPSSVGPNLRPQTPADLPAGLQQMGRMNAVMAQQSMQATGVTVRRTMVAVAVPYAVTLGALAAPAIGSLGTEAGIQVAARFPTATAAATNIGNALTGTTLPRAATAIGGAVIAGGAARELPALGPELQSSISTVGSQNSIDELNALFGQKVQDNANRVLSSLSRGDISVLRGWLTAREYNATVRALVGDLEPRIAQANVGKVIERMVARDIQSDPRTAPFFQWVAGPNKPDFYGRNVLEGFFWDVTTAADQYAHEFLRWYSPRTFVHPY